MSARTGVDPLVRIRRVEPAEWKAYRDLRLEALRSDPLAFGSTLEREQGFSEEQWRDRITRDSPVSPSATWAAVDRADGFVGIVVAARVDGAFHVFAMRVAPELRRKGIGGRLLDAALEWVDRVAPGNEIWLEVNPREVAAVGLYGSRGFRPTGRTSALEHSPGERVNEMIRPA
jgi:ribosomal protein S18 acetylase RimI-like enzyme